MNTIGRSDIGTAFTERLDRLRAPKYAMGDKLCYEDGKILGTIVEIRGNPPCRFYGVRSPDLVGIVMIRQSVLEDPEQYRLRVVNVY